MTASMNGNWKTIMAASGFIIAGLAAVFGYGQLTSDVEAIANKVSDNSVSIERLESGRSDVRERLKALETGQKFQTDILMEIKRNQERQQRSNNYP
jgi:hypothetical protein